MSQKVLDDHGRWRSKTVAFRMSPEEDLLLDRYVAVSGLTKQDYIIDRLLYRRVTVQGNPRVYKALKTELAAVLEELKRIRAGEKPDPELLRLIDHITEVLGEMKEGNG